MINRIQPNNYLVNQNQNNYCSNIRDTLIKTINKIAEFFRILFYRIFCCKAPPPTNPLIAQQEQPAQRADIVAVNPQALRAAANLRLSQYGKSTSPPLPQDEQIPNINEIRIEELLQHYINLFPNPEDRQQLTQRHVEDLIQFVNNQRPGDVHSNEEYTTGIQLGIRFIIVELRKPEVSNDLKIGAFFSICSFLIERQGCHPRRYEDIYGQVDHLRNSGRDLRSNIIFWNATDKEDILSRCCLRNHASWVTLVHHLNKARRDIGLEWGLKRDPVAIHDHYIENFARTTPDEFRRYLDQYYTPAHMIQQTKERLSMRNNHRLFNAEIQEHQNNLPDNWEATFYERDQHTPSYAGVTFVLRAMGFLE